MRRLRPEEEVRAADLERRQTVLEKRLEEKAKATAERLKLHVSSGPDTDLERRLFAKLGVTPTERANVLASTDVIGPGHAQDIVRRVGAMELLGQLSRMEEADRVLQLAWEAELFADCITYTPGLRRRGEPADLDANRLEETREAIRQRALDLLADQYGDLHVKVTPFERWTDVRRLRKCPVRTLGGPERGGK